MPAARTRAAARPAVPATTPFPEERPASATHIQPATVDHQNATTMEAPRSKGSDRRGNKTLANAAMERTCRSFAIITADRPHTQAPKKRYGPSTKNRNGGEPA